MLSHCRPSAMRPGRAFFVRRWETSGLPASTQGWGLTKSSPLASPASHQLLSLARVPSRGSDQQKQVLRLQGSSRIVPILNPPPSSLPIPSLWVVPVHQPQASGIVHRTWTGNSFHTCPGSPCQPLQPWALSLPDKELCLREALAVCTPPAPEPSAKRPGS